MMSSGAHTKTSEEQLLFRSEDVPTEDHEDNGGDRAHSRRGAVRVKAEKRGTVQAYAWSKVSEGRLEHQVVREVK